MDEYYIKVEWPEYQQYQEEPWFETEAYFCADENVYFIPRRILEGE